ELGGDGTGGDDGGADAIGLHLLPQPLGNDPHGVLGGRIDGVAGSDLVAGDRGDVDDLPRSLRLHVGQGGGDTVEHALDVDIDHPVPIRDLQAVERGMRHQAGIVDDDV